MTDTSSWLWIVIDVGAVAVLGAAMAYGGMMGSPAIRLKRAFRTIPRADCTAARLTGQAGAELARSFTPS